MTYNQNGVAWDLTDYFPVFNGPDMQQFTQKLQADIAALLSKGHDMGALSENESDNWAAFVLQVEDAGKRLGHLMSYLECLTAAFADREDYAVADAAGEGMRAEYKKIESQIVLAFKDVEARLWQAFLEHPQCRPIRYFLQRLREKSRYSMSSGQEMLASDLNLDGLQAWGRLYNKITGKLTFAYKAPDGTLRRLPISQWRSLMSDPDRSIGKAAFEGGNLAWQSIEDVCGAALNAIAGSRLSLYRHRGRADFLDEALFQAGLSRRTLEAMYEAISKQMEIARDIFRTKAGFFNRPGIWFFEREAPLPIRTTSHYDWPQMVDLVGSAFDAAYPALAGYFRAMLERGWIESERRPAKRPGAFCTHSVVNRQQRVFMTFSGTLGNATTLAHEVGHAWHSHLMRDLRPWAGIYPMTLAETASTFAENLLAEGIYGSERLAEQDRFLMLDEQLSSAAVFLLDITTRFEFEKAFYELRREGEIPVTQIKQLMVDTQRRIFGDALLDDGADSYFWASKLHFYITGTTFYNFPYTFGFLLAKALGGMYQQDRKSFLPRYEQFLRLTGSACVEDVVRQSIGEDIGRAEFWEDALKGLSEPLQQYGEWIENFRAENQ